VVSFDAAGNVMVILEKPLVSSPKFAVMGLCFLDCRAPKFTAQCMQSARSELELVDLLAPYLDVGSLRVETKGRGYAWLEPDSRHSSGRRLLPSHPDRTSRAKGR